MNDTMGNIDMKKEETGDKALAGLPYLYRAKGLPSEVYETRFYKKIDGEALQAAIEDAVLRYPYFAVRFKEKDGDFYAVKNELPLKALHTDKLVPLGGHSNNYHLMGITYWEDSLYLSFHHGFTDGRGAKSFLETLVTYYADYASAKVEKALIEQIKQKHIALAGYYSDEECIDPCAAKYKFEGNGRKIEGLGGKAYRLPEASDKAEHRRYEIRFSQEQFMSACKEIGASPITYLSMLMSRGIKEAHPECDKAIVSNFPMDARHILGCDKTFKNCVKSMTLPYGNDEAQLSDIELMSKYRELLEVQKDRDHCAREFNNIHMLLEVISHFHSFASRQKLLGFMENLALDTYLISYIGRFDMPAEHVKEVHLYSNCSSGLVLNMTCQSGYFIIDLTQDFESEKYVDALSKQFERAGVETKISEEIQFETPFDELKEIITSPADTSEQVKNMFDKIKTAAKASAEAAKERAEAAKNMGPKVTALYYDLASGTMKEFDPTKTTQGQLIEIAKNAPSMLIS